MRFAAYIFVLIGLLATAACGDDDSTATDADAGMEEFRPEPDPGQVPGSNNGSNNGTGNSGNGVPNNGQPNNSNPNSDAGNNGDDCTGFSECVLGSTRCVLEQIQECIDDGDGDNCGTLDVPKDCASPQQYCSEGACVTDTECIDNDGDGYGANCAAGPDCDDTNPDRFPGNPEVCDGIDNDCNGGADDTAGLGGTCTTGTGACMATGVPACEGTNQVCNVANPPGTTEVCDQIDNDCDGQIDEGNVCSTPMCPADPFEVNDTPMTAHTLTMNTRNDATMCGVNEDWFAFPTTANKMHRVTITFPNSFSDLDLEIYEDGVLLDRSISAFSDTESVQFRARANRNYTARVFNAGTDDNFYYLQVLDIVHCQQDDGFHPNQTIDDAPYFPPGWSSYAYACPGKSDYYSMGEIQMGTTFDVNLYDVDFADDLDLHLWADPNGDGVWDKIASSTGYNSNESITFTAGHTGDFYFQVVDHAGNGALYDMDWFD